MKRRAAAIRAGVIQRPVAAALVVLMAAALAGCLRPPRWRAVEMPHAEDVEAALAARDFAELDRSLLASEIARIPMRERLRPCCAFGADLGAKLGGVPIPAYQIGNILDADRIGPHTYDSGILRIRRAEQESLLLNNERNGLVYTCRGGFIDIAHVRDYADWASYLGSAFAQHAEEGGRIELPPEGASRSVVFEPVPPEVQENVSRIEMSAAVGAWIGYQLSVWHEMATWFGWSAVPAFPEKVSAFSPEDLYSNLLGIKIARAVAHRRSSRSEDLYNPAITRWLGQALPVLGAVPREQGREAMYAVDGLWWDSSRRLPHPHLVLRRSFGEAGGVEPWLIPPERMPDSLKAACGEKPEPLPMVLRDTIEGRHISEFVRLELVLEDSLARQEPFTRIGREITQADFPAIVEAMRAQNREEFGPRSDKPD